MRFCYAAVCLFQTFPVQCVCDKQFNEDHYMICKKGGFVSSRHNDIHDNICNILDEVCNDVTKEPALQPLTGEQLDLATAKIADSARLDISARRFWSDVP